MRHDFVLSTLRTLQADGWLDPGDSVLAICAGEPERRVFLEAGLKQATISNLDDRMVAPDYAPYEWSYQDAQRLSFEAGSFDHVFVSDGLHHCDSPHRGLLEMCRAARKSVIVFESRDSLLLRLGNRIGLVPDHEVEAVIGSGLTHGGVNNTEIPNYVYRWTEREFEKTLSAHRPEGRSRFRYFYKLNLPLARVGMGASRLKLLALQLARPVAWLVARLAPRQGNSFCMVARLPGADDLWPWLERIEGRVVFKRSYAAHYRRQSDS